MLTAGGQPIVNEWLTKMFKAFLLSQAETNLWDYSRSRISQGVWLKLPPGCDFISPNNCPNLLTSLPFF